MISNCCRSKEQIKLPSSLYTCTGLGKPQKNGFFSGPGGKGLATKKKDRFLKLNKKSGNFFVASKLEGGGKALVAGPLKKSQFFAASLQVK